MFLGMILLKRCRGRCLDGLLFGKPSQTSAHNPSTLHKNARVRPTVTGIVFFKLWQPLPQIYSFSHQPSIVKTSKSFFAAFWPITIFAPCQSTPVFCPRLAPISVGHDMAAVFITPCLPVLLTCTRFKWFPTATSVPPISVRERILRKSLGLRIRAVCVTKVESVLWSRTCHQYTKTWYVLCW